MKQIDNIKLVNVWSGNTHNCSLSLWGNKAQLWDEDGPYATIGEVSVEKGVEILHLYDLSENMSIVNQLLCRKIIEPYDLKLFGYFKINWPE